MSALRPLAVEIAHDLPQGIWYVLSSDVAGLNAEADSFDELIAIIEDLAPDLIAANVPAGGEGPTNIALSVRHVVNVSRGRAA